MIDAPCLSAPVRCALVASPVDKFTDLSFWSQNMPPQTINEQVFYPGHKETLSPVILGEIGVFSVWS